MPLPTTIDSANSFLDDVAELRTIVGLGADDYSRDWLLITCANVAAALMNTYCGRRLKSRVYSGALWDGKGGTILDAREWPIVSVTSLKADDGGDFDAATALTQYVGTGAQGDFGFMVAGPDADELVRLDGDVWPNGRRLVQISGTIGYTVATAPDLLSAQIRVATYLFHRHGDDEAVTRVQAPGEAQDLQRQGALPDAAKVILTAYRRTGEHGCD